MGLWARTPLQSSEKGFLTVEYDWPPSHPHRPDATKKARRRADTFLMPLIHQAGQRDTRKTKHRPHQCNPRAPPPKPGSRFTIMEKARPHRRRTKSIVGDAKASPHSTTAFRLELPQPLPAPTKGGRRTNAPPRRGARPSRPPRPANTADREPHQCSPDRRPTASANPPKRARSAATKRPTCHGDATPGRTPPYCLSIQNPKTKAYY